VLAELLGKTGGICEGKGGSMHITSVEHGYLFGRQCAGLQAGGEGGRARAWSDGTFRLLDVLAQDGDGRATDRSGAGP
jgi:TPP-dependent pyruvate/acetoin dehydrogenase alpha subunit